MPERISDELLAQSPVTHDEHARALKELIYERVMQNRRKDADAQQDAALAKLAEENTNAEAEARLDAAIEKMDAVEPDQPKPAAKPKAKKEK